MLKLRHAGAAAAAAVVLAGCASDPYYDAYNDPYHGTRYSTPATYYGNGAYADFGRVVAIDVVRDGGGASGAGAVVGGIVGGVLGHQIGSGRGQDLATAAGAIGGAVAGHRIEERRGGGVEYYRVTVQFPDGREATFAQDSLHGVRVGDRVRVDAGRVLPG